VVGGRDEHRVDVLLRLEHLAEVGVVRGVGAALGGVAEVVLVDVAQRHDLRVGHLQDALDVLPPAAGDADDGDGELLVGRDGAGDAGPTGGDPHPGAEGGAGGLEELTTG
jgi:hypothetical protein